MTGAGRQRGTVTIWVALIAAFVLSGLLVMSVDVGRFYLIQGELQTAADSAALAAATQLVGTAGADANATNQVTAAFDTTDSNDNRFNLHQNQIGIGGFSNSLITNMAVDFFSNLTDALSGGGGGQTGPSARFVRVQVTAQAPVLFTRLLDPTFDTGPSVVAAAVAGLSSPVCTACGIDDLAVVDQSSGSDPVDYGFLPGSFYTLFLTASQLTTGSGTVCSATPQGATLDPSDTSLVEYAILDHVPQGPLPGDGDSTLFELGAGGMAANPPAGSTTPGSSTIGLVEAELPDQAPIACPGRDIVCGLNSRFVADPTSNACGTLAGGEFVSLAPSYSQDTDVGNAATNLGSEDYSTEYAGNLRRVLTLPVVDATDTLTVLNFRQFLIETTAASPDSLVNPAAATVPVAGAFRVQYLGTPVPIHCGGVGGACTVSFGVGRTILH